MDALLLASSRIASRETHVTPKTVHGFNAEAVKSLVVREKPNEALLRGPYLWAYDHSLFVKRMT
jgi:hypothetical protein